MSSRFPAVVLVLLLVVPLFAACADTRLPSERLVFTAVDGSPVEVDAEIAKSREEQAQGLMWRKKLEDGKGMLFWYAADTRMHFWMKNTLVPLSIAFIDSSGTIREIYDMESGDLSVVSSTISMRYALEVPSGWFDRVAIEPGCRLDAESLALLKAIR